MTYILCYFHPLARVQLLRSIFYIFKYFFIMYSPYWTANLTVIYHIIYGELPLFLLWKTAFFTVENLDSRKYHKFYCWKLTSSCKSIVSPANKKYACRFLLSTTNLTAHGILVSNDRDAPIPLFLSPKYHFFYCLIETPHVFPQAKRLVKALYSPYLF